MKTIAFSNHLYATKSLVLLALWAMSIYLHAQIMTQPLFMQIKTPKLESYAGIQIDPYGNTYHINSTGKDSIDISFLISVPKEMLSEKWAISLMPSIYSSTENGRLKDVVVKGWKFAEVQEQGYEKYNEFMNSIIDSSLYEKMYIDQKRLEKEIEHRHDMYWQFYYDEWERQIEYEIWKGEQDGSIQTFFTKDKLSYGDQLRDQYLLRIENQSKRYLKANMDTTGLYAKYMREFKNHNAKMPRYFVGDKVPLKNVPKKFKYIYKSGRTLQDITNSMLELLVKRDSALMALPVLDYNKIIENEKRTILQAGIYDDIVQLPKNENALLDTVVYDMRSDYRYLYTYRYPVHKSQRDTIKVKLQSKILATDGSGFSTSSEDILTYAVAPLTPIISSTPQSTPSVNKKKDEEIERIKKQDEQKLRDEELLKKISDRLLKLNSSSNEDE